MRTYISTISFTALLIASLVACNKKMTFSPADAIDGFNTGENDGAGGNNSDPGNGSPADPPSCTVTYNNVITPVKVLFLVDKTGSNKDNSNTAAQNDGTDPTKSWRLNAINDLRDNLSLSIFSFNITLFRGNHTNINDGYRYGGAGGELTKSLINGFSNDPTTINSAISAFESDPDQGKTPYEAALAKAKATISADILTDNISKYSVILVTDGHPDPNLVTKTDCGSRVCDPNNGADADVPKSIDVARGFVDDLVNVSPGRINLNTVYYYSTGQHFSSAVDILSNMADAGKGAFIEISSNSGQTIEFHNVVRVPANVCP